MGIFKVRFCYFKRIKIRARSKLRNNSQDHSKKVENMIIKNQLAGRLMRMKVNLIQEIKELTRDEEDNSKEIPPNNIKISSNNSSKRAMQIIQKKSI